MLLLWYFYERKDHPEPRVLVLKVFLLGMLMFIPAALVEALFPVHGFDFLVAAICEEALKFSYCGPTYRGSAASLTRWTVLCTAQRSD